MRQLREEFLILAWLGGMGYFLKPKWWARNRLVWTRVDVCDVYLVYTPAGFLMEDSPAISNNKSFAKSWQQKHLSFLLLPCLFLLRWNLTWARVGHVVMIPTPFTSNPNPKTDLYSLFKPIESCRMRFSSVGISWFFLCERSRFGPRQKRFGSYE